VTVPPDNLPIYRVLTGPDDAAFCHRVSEALGMGYRLLGSPACTFDGRVILAQAIVWPQAETLFPGRDTVVAGEHPIRKLPETTG
jgi:hypothetical protein